jgi:hypothetical protein
MVKCILQNKKVVILAGSLFFLVVIFVGIIFYLHYKGKQNHLVDSLKRILENNGSIFYYKDGDIDLPINENISLRDLEIYNKITRHKIKYINGIACNGYQLPIQDIVSFSTFKHLDYLGFSNTNLSENQLKTLAEKIPHLNILTIERSTFPNNGGKHLGKLKNLKTLWLSQLSIRDESTEGMSGLPLNEIVFFDLPITDVGLNNMLPLVELEYISLINLKITDNGITNFVNSCPSLKKIYINNLVKNGTPSELKCTFLRDTIHISSIKDITLNYVLLNDDILSSIERFENLKYLSIRTYCVIEKSEPLLEKLSQRMYVSVETLGTNGETLFEYRGGKEFIE